MTHLVNLKKCRGSSPGCPGYYGAPGVALLEEIILKGIGRDFLMWIDFHVTCVYDNVKSTTDFYAKTYRANSIINFLFKIISP